jgi:hypothetical protein
LALEIRVYKRLSYKIPPGAAGEIKLVISGTSTPINLIDGIAGLSVNPVGILQRDNVGFHKAAASAWTFENGTLTNESQNGGTEADGTVAIVLDLKDLSNANMSKIKLDFDYDMADAKEQIYVHIWGYKENANTSSASSFLMNLVSTHGHAWEHSDTDLFIDTEGSFDEYNLGWDDARWDGNNAGFQGLASGAADFISGITGPQHYSKVIDLASFSNAPALVKDYDYIVIGLSRRTDLATSAALSISNFQLKAMTK